MKNHRPLTAGLLLGCMTLAPPCVLAQEISGDWGVVPYHVDVGTGDSDLDPDGPIVDMNLSGSALGASFRW